MAVLSGGRTVYGLTLGILMLDTRFPRPPGDVGHAATWPFPVCYRVVRGAEPHRIMGDAPDPALVGPFVEAARELEAMGVGAITTSCGFLAAFQPELAQAVRVPVLTSALLQAPMVARMIAPRRVAVLTEREHLGAPHWRGAGWTPDDFPVVVAAMPPGAVFPTVHIDNALTCDTDVLSAEMVAFARTTAAAHPDVGAFVLECTNFGPYSQAIRRATGLPVYDLHTQVMQTVLATQGRSQTP